jgi:hypothetical protein
MMANTARIPVETRLPMNLDIPRSIVTSLEITS